MLKCGRDDYDIMLALVKLRLKGEIVFLVFLDYTQFFSFIFFFGETRFDYIIPIPTLAVTMG